MQEMANKDREIKKSQSITNNVINEIKTIWRAPTVE